MSQRTRREGTIEAIKENIYMQCFIGLPSFETESKLQRNLDGFGLKLIKTVGVAGVIIGLAILVAFWWWVIKLLYKVG